ncbi:MAG: hypothetical protein LBG15_07255, partial [Dysgonamonadaceae bacterium]|nr:hypothetical protein [Dysgonamonadaceae bacterium]
MNTDQIITEMKPNIKPFRPCSDGLEYYESKASFEEAWRDCPRGDWMLWMADRLEIDDRTLTRAKALCANTVRHLMKDKRSTDAVDAALRYADGEIGREELGGYAAAANNVLTYDAYANPYANASFSAYYAVRAVFPSNAAIYADDASYYATKRTSNQLVTANICREVLTEAVMEK